MVFFARVVSEKRAAEARATRNPNLQPPDCETQTDNRLTKNRTTAMKQGRMELYAIIDSRNYAIVGRFGRDEEWVDSNNFEPVRAVYNENGGRKVTLEDIAYATVEVAGIVYAAPDVKKFEFDNLQNQQP